MLTTGAPCWASQTGHKARVRAPAPAPLVPLGDLEGARPGSGAKRKIGWEETLPVRGAQSYWNHSKIIQRHKNNHVVRWWSHWKWMMSWAIYHPCMYSSRGNICVPSRRQQLTPGPYYSIPLEVEMETLSPKKICFTLDKDFIGTNESLGTHLKTSHQAKTDIAKFWFYLPELLETNCSPVWCMQILDSFCHLDILRISFNASKPKPL